MTDEQFTTKESIDKWLETIKGGLIGENTALKEKLRECKFRFDRLNEQYNKCREIVKIYDQDILELSEVLQLLLDETINENEWNQNKLRAERLIERLGVQDG